MFLDNLLLTAIEAALDAGKQIREVYKQSDIEIEYKEDQSPVTKADKLAHYSIIRHLKTIKIPIISEEDTVSDLNSYKSPSFWLIDPLDGTKDFIARTGEFGVNIALINQGEPIIGVVYLPVISELYFGHKESGSFLIKSIQTIGQLAGKEITKIKLPTGANSRPILLQSRMYPNKANEHCAQLLSEILQDDVMLMELGSTAKYTEIAKGHGWFYPRENSLHKWDIAAGDAIIRFAGGNVFDLRSGEPIKYNSLSHKIAPFLAVSFQAMKKIPVQELILLFQQNILI